ncbi:ATP synthase subunit s, mitochondrial-like [Anabrus simplex]|uniref:ATP synthase subunit s, mitochondrial-like n=1 Tax=Anabrus simplex TaxID=316456 RepID=UPI0034DD901C
MTSLLTNLIKARPPLSNHRNLWAWLNIVWNSYDQERVKDVGPDRACAEWLMRNGAFIKWSGDQEYTKDYNALPETSKEHPCIRFIEEIDATEASILYVGFIHFTGCNHIKRIKFHRCYNIEDRALENLSIVKDSLQHLQVSSCGNVSDNGILALKILENLKTLLLFDLPEFKKRDECLKTLKESLPNCKIQYGCVKPMEGSLGKGTKEECLE